MKGTALKRTFGDGSGAQIAIAINLFFNSRFRRPLVIEGRGMSAASDFMSCRAPYYSWNCNFARLTLSTIPYITLLITA